MNSQRMISQLRIRLQQMEQEVLRHDQRLNLQAQKLLENVERFNGTLFQQQGAKLLPCITQLAKQIDKLAQQLTVKPNAELIAHQCGQIEDQFTALRRALATTSLNVKDAQLQKLSKQKKFRQFQANQHQQSEFTWIAQNVMSSSHHLYQELAKHQQWSMRIQDKVRELQLTLEHCPAAEKIPLQQQILATQHRLGKCNQAISYIEERIQFLEKPSSERRHFSSKRFSNKK